MHKKLSLSLVVLDYASPLDYSHLNPCITWDSPSVWKKKVFPSANKMFSDLSVDIWTCSHCSGETPQSSFRRQFPHHTSDRERESRSHWKVNVEMTADKWTKLLPPLCSAESIPQDQHLLLGALWISVCGHLQQPPQPAPPVSLCSPCSPERAVMPQALLQANTTTTFSEPREGICCLSVLVEGDHLAAAQHHQKLTCECPLCLAWEQREEGVKQVSPTLAQHIQPGCLLFTDLLHQQQVLVFMKPGRYNSLLA